MIEDFIYSEEVTSPDGSIRVLYAYTDGEKTPLIIEPRIIDARSGFVVNEDGSVEDVGDHG
jgi:hypothetical protein